MESAFVGRSVPGSEGSEFVGCAGPGYKFVSADNVTEFPSFPEDASLFLDIICICL